MMPYLVIYLFIIASLILLSLGDTKRKKKQRLQKIWENWGKPKKEYFNFDLIENYSRLKNKPSFHQLSLQTTNDIDFYHLFSFIDRTTTRVGQQLLIYKLKRPTNNITVLKDLDEQASLFANNKLLRQNVQAILMPLAGNDSYYIADLMKEKVWETPKWKKFLVLDSLLGFILLVLLPIYPGTIIWMMVLFAINLFLHFRNKNNTFQFLRSFPQLNLLINISKKLYKQNVQRKEAVAEGITNLKQFQKNFVLLNFGQTYGDDLAQVAWYFLELVKVFFLVDVHAFNRLIHILENRKKDILSLFQYIGEIDCAISIASLREGPLETCKPDFLTTNKELYARNIFHPLIDNCVPNSISVTGKSIVITGSNMSGKTSFLRTVAINSLLAQSIYTCFGQSFSTPILKLISFIRIDDNLFEGKSYYLAEVEAMRNLIEHVDTEFQHLFILDEVFKGTNTIERIASGKAILSYLNKKDNIVLVSTHDTDLPFLLQTEYDLHHFEERIIHNELKFDHLLKPGPLKTRNAIKILEISNYPIQIIKEAKEISKRLVNS